MKLPFTVLTGFLSPLETKSLEKKSYSLMTHSKMRPHCLAGCFLTLTAIATSYPAATWAQALPTPLPPTPHASSEPSLASEQYVVLVNGNSDLLLEQVRQIEPSAFVNYVEGTSVIQAGRFNSLQNAQQRANELAIIGIGAQIKSSVPVSAPIAVTTPTDYASSVPIATNGTLPPIPVAATPPAVEFGQSPPVQTATPPPTPVSPSSVPVYPVNVTPPPSAAPPMVQQALPSGYYVVVPGRSAELTNLANRIVSLGAAPSAVQTRTSPRGPHVSVGPYNDRGLAREWRNYLRDSGLDARIYFE